MSFQKRKAVILFAIVLLLAHAGGVAATQINKYETKVIEEGIQKTFDELIQMWKEELYFEMYGFGQAKSRQILSKEEFAQRMVELKWKPALEGVRMDGIRIVYRNFVAVHCFIEFENKVNPTRKVTKRLIFPAILEKRNWKFNLLQIIRVPFGGEEYTPKEPTEKGKAKTAGKKREQ